MTAKTSYEEMSIEKVRSFWDRRPCNIRHSPREVGTKEYFEEVETRKYFVEPHIPVFADFKRWKGKKVLEIGCGIGTDTINFARHGAKVTAVELSESSLEIAKTRARVFGLQDRVSFYSGNAEQLSDFLPVDCYDLVYSFGVIHHTPNPESILQQIHRYLHSDGILKIMVYHRHSLKVFSTVLMYGKGRFWRMEELVARHSEAQTGCPVTFTYTKRQAAELLRKHKFQVIDVRVDHIFPYRVADYVEYRYVKVWPFRWMPENMFRGLERKFGWHLCLTARPAGMEVRSESGALGVGTQAQLAQSSEATLK